MFYYILLLFFILFYFYMNYNKQTNVTNIPKSTIDKEYFLNLYKKNIQKKSKKTRYCD